MKISPKGIGGRVLIFGKSWQGNKSIVVLAPGSHQEEKGFFLMVPIFDLRLILFDILNRFAVDS